MEKTTNDLAKDLGVSADLLRKFLRTRPDLRDAGRLIGPMRVYTPEQAEAIGAAFGSRGDGRRHRAREAEVA